MHHTYHTLTTKRQFKWSYYRTSTTKNRNLGAYIAKN